MVHISLDFQLINAKLQIIITMINASNNITMKLLPFYTGFLQFCTSFETLLIDETVPRFKEPANSEEVNVQARSKSHVRISIVSLSSSDHPHHLIALVPLLLLLL